MREKIICLVLLYFFMHTTHFYERYKICNLIKRNIVNNATCIKKLITIVFLEINFAY